MPAWAIAKKEAKNAGIIAHLKIVIGGIREKKEIATKKAAMNRRGAGESDKITETRIARRKINLETTLLRWEKLLLLTA